MPLSSAPRPHEFDEPDMSEELHQSKPLVAFELVVIGALLVGGIACAVAVVGFLSGHWVLGASALPALMGIVLLIAFLGAGRRRRDTSGEMHDIE